jgi:hypothetical protein
VTRLYVGYSPAKTKSRISRTARRPYWRMLEVPYHLTGRTLEECTARLQWQQSAATFGEQNGKCSRPYFKFHDVEMGRGGPGANRKRVCPSAELTYHTHHSWMLFELPRRTALCKARRVSGGSNITIEGVIRGRFAHVCSPSSVLFSSLCADRDFALVRPDTQAGPHSASRTKRRKVKRWTL